MTREVSQPGGGGRGIRKGVTTAELLVGAGAETGLPAKKASWKRPYVRKKLEQGSEEKGA